MALPVWSGQHNFGVEQDEYLDRGFPAQMAARSRIQMPPRTNVSSEPPLQARVDANRWIAECPDCHDAYYVWPGHSKPLFMCGLCLNATVGHVWRRVAIPNNWAQIEAALRARPLPQTRFWLPGETVTALRAENAARGLPDEVA